MLKDSQGRPYNAERHSRGKPVRRFNVSTDAGREPGDMFPLLHNVSSSTAHAVQHALERAGWRVEQTPGDEDE